MPDTLTPPSQETATPETPIITPAPVEEAVPTERESVIAKYNKIYGSEPEVPATPVVVETPAAVTVEEPVEAAPVESTPTEPPAKTETQLLLEAVRQLADEVKILKNPAPPTPAPVVAEPVAPPDWMKALQTGDKEAFEAAIRAIAAPATDKLAQQTMSEVLETLRVKDELNTFISDLRSKNADVVPFEKWIVIEAQEELMKLKAEGKIANNDDYIKAYKQSVNNAVASTRKVLQLNRAAGKEEAMTTKKTVLSASAVPPAAIDQNRGQVVKEEPPTMQSAEDYLAARQAKNRAQRGL